MATKLTQRERDVLTLIAAGRTNRQISEELVVTLSTVKWYIRQIYAKLGATDRQEAISFARKQNLVLSSGIPRSNLPLSATPFVGRKQELAALDKLISDPHSRAITVLGAGGIGKTCLALEAARQQLEKSTFTSGKTMEPAFPDGIIFVSLTSVDKTEDIIPVLGDALQIPMEFGAGILRSARQQLLDNFQGKNILLIIDNFEHLLEGADLLGDIISAAPESCLLITSRERLQLSSEQLFPIQGLPVPDPLFCDENDIQQYAAAELFLNTARRVQPDFSLSLDEVAYLAQICRLVEGMPLGIELAASWVSVLPVADIVREIEQNLGFLATELRDVPARHRSMQSALEASWKRLRKEQRVAFQDLSFFRGGTRSAALDVASASLPLLVTLSSKSWLSYDRRIDRYHIHELLRQYGALKLSEDRVREEATRDRHSAFFCSYLGEREAGWRGRRQKEIASEIKGESKNIRAAWEWALKQQRYRCLDDGLDSLCLFYDWEGRSADALESCRTLSYRLSQLSISNPEILCLQARALTWESEFSADRAAVEPMLDRSQDLLERTALEGHDVSKELAFLQLQRGLTTFRRDYTVARRMFENALVRYRVTGISWGEAEALEGIGSCYLFIGEHDRAVELFRMCLIIQKKIGNSLGAAELLGELGLVAKHQGRLKEAEDYHSESLRLFRELGHQLREIHMAGTLAYTLDWSGKFEPAEQIARKGLAAAIRTERVIYSLLTGSNKSWPESPGRAMQELRGCFVTEMTRYRVDSLQG